MNNEFVKYSEMNEQLFRTCGTQLKDFIWKRQEVMLDKSDDNRDAVESMEKLETYIAEHRRRFISELGGWKIPDAPLYAKTLQKRDMGEFILENVVFQSRPHVYVTGNLYLPKGMTKPGPAVLFLSGHWTEGRMCEQYCHVCQILVRAGLAVFAIDPSGQGERSNYYDPETKQCFVPRGVADHNACGVPALATGDYLAGFFLLDQMRAVDYMITRPEIDPEKIGVTGNSGGGTQTVVMMVCDSRIAAAAPATFLTVRREFLHTGMSQDMEQIWPSCAEYGFDHADALIAFAPKPVAVLALTSDFFPIEGTRKAVQDAKKIYRLFGKESDIRLYEDDYWHNYTNKLAVCAAEFFSEVLGNEKKTVSCDNLMSISEDILHVTGEGQVRGEYKDAVTVMDEVRCHAELQRTRRKLQPDDIWNNNAERWLRERVLYQREPVELNPRFFQYSEQNDEEFSVTRLTWWTQKRLFSGGVLIRSAQYGNRRDLPTIIAVWDDGTKKLLAYREWISKQCTCGYQILVLDLPGSGQLEEYNFTGPYPYKGEYGPLYHLGCDLLFMGDSMAAMHGYDVMRTIEMVQTEFGIAEEDITLFCDENDGVYGIIAAFLKKHIKLECGEHLIRSVETEFIGKDTWYSNNAINLILPGMLEYFDYEELIQKCPR